MNDRFQYDEAYFRSHFSSPSYLRRVARRNRFIHELTTSLVSSGRLLEIGFGDDNLIRYYADDFDVYGIDISDFAVKSLPSRYDPTHFRVCDIAAQEVPFDVRFDLIIAINVLEHLSSPEPALRRLFDALSPGGVLGLYLPTQSNVLSRVQYRLLYDVPEHTFRPSVPDLRKLLVSVGFKRHSEYAASFLPLRRRVTSDFLIRSLNLYFGIWTRA